MSNNSKMLLNIFTLTLHTVQNKTIITNTENKIPETGSCRYYYEQPASSYDKNTQNTKRRHILLWLVLLLLLLLLLQNY